MNGSMSGRPPLKAAQAVQADNTKKINGQSINVGAAAPAAPADYDVWIKED